MPTTACSHGHFPADFNEHPTAYLTAGLFEQHDKSRFEITALSFGQNDNSPVRRRLEAAFEHFIDVRDNSDQEIAALMRRAEIDIAVDLMGFTKDNRLGVLARRAAPIQVNYLGYPGTTGSPCIDRISADTTVIPEDCDAFSARERGADPRNLSDQRQPACDQPTHAVAWRMRLAAKRFRVLLLQQPAEDHAGDFRYLDAAGAGDGRQRALADNGKSPKGACTTVPRGGETRCCVRSGWIFAPKASVADHLARHRQADLCLDTLPYNAHTTASDALWAGLPVLTCLGETFAGRVAASLLKAIGLDELITRTLAEYEALALRLARDPAYLATLKDTLNRNRDTCLLFDTQSATRHIEAAYLTMAEIAGRREKPRSFSVERP